MNLKLKESYENEVDYGAGEGTEEKYIYYCPCGKGEVIQEDCNVPGFRSHDCYIMCKECSKKWDVKKINGNWELIPIKIENKKTD